MKGKETPVWKVRSNIGPPHHNEEIPFMIGFSHILLVQVFHMKAEDSSL